MEKYPFIFSDKRKHRIRRHAAFGTIITKQSVSSIEAMLLEKSFIRTHRSFIVSLDKIKTFTSELIEIDKTEVPIGKLYRNGVMKMLG